MANRPISPVEPTKKHPHIQPNAHPYAIKTTSSALLSRSNSSPHSAHHTRHHYVPSSRAQTGTRARHYHSSSLPSIEAKVHGEVRSVPMPLPTPPSITVALPDNPSPSLKHADEPKLTHRVRRAETMPSSNATTAITGRHNYDQQHKYYHDQDSRLELYAGLPLNPKQWTTEELTTYLEMSLSSDTNRDKDDTLVDILECVRTRGLTGRELLRLTDADLLGTPLSGIQTAQLLECSRTLRADVLRGRIYADSYHSHEFSDDSNAVYSKSALPSTPFHSIRGASLSLDDLRLLPDDNTGVYEDVFPPSPAKFLHRSNSASDAPAKRYRDLAHMRMCQRGKVKGLVETWERASTSGSECSAGEEGLTRGCEAESESEIDPMFDSISNVMRSPESTSDLLSSPSPHDEPFHDMRSSMANSKVIPQESLTLTPPPPYTHMYTELEVVGDEGEEPTIEELLASSSDIPLRGARAWEADFGLGDTVKHISVCTSANAGSTSPSAMESDTSRAKDDGKQTQRDSVRFKGSGMQRSTGSRGNNAKTQKRVITAIFTGSPSDDMSENIGDEMTSEDHHRLTSGVNGIIRDRVSARADLQNGSDSTLRALEASIALTRAEVEAFRLRLEAVETDTTRREAELEQAQYSSPRPSSGFELRRRRSEANEQTTAATEQSGDETLAKGLGDAPVGWVTTSMRNIARAIVVRAIGWVFPYGHIGTFAREDQDRSRPRAGSHPGVNDRYPTPAKRSGRLSVVHMSCSIVLLSFALCAAVLRRIGLGRWVRRP